jgi:hypothetical protein
MHTTWRRIAGLLLMGLSGLGCGESTTTQVTGAVNGAQLQSPSAVYNVYTGSSVFYKDDVYVTISDTPELCQAASREIVPGIHLYFNNGFLVNEREVDPERNSLTESVPDGGQPMRYKDAEGVWVSSDGHQYLAQSGTVRVDDYDTDDSAGTAQGGFDLAFETGDRVAGTFSADYCATMQTAAHNCTCAVAGGEAWQVAGLIGLFAARRRVRRRPEAPGFSR